MPTIATHVEPQLFTLREAENILKRRVSTLRKDIAKGRISHVRLGRQIRIPREVVDQMIADGWCNALTRKKERE